MSARPLPGAARITGALSAPDATGTSAMVMEKSRASIETTRSLVFSRASDTTTRASPADTASTRSDSSDTTGGCGFVTNVAQAANQNDTSTSGAERAIAATQPLSRDEIIGRGAIRQPSYIESEMHHIAIAHDIFP